MDAGTLVLVGSDADKIESLAMRLLDDPPLRQKMVDVVNPFGDGRAAQRIRAALEHLVFDTPSPTSYGGAFLRESVLEAAGYDRHEIEFTRRRIAEAHPDIVHGSAAYVAQRA